MPRYLNWIQHRTVSILDHDGVLYSAKWAPDTLADRVINSIEGLPATEWQGVHIDGNVVSRMDDEAFAKYKTILAGGEDGAYVFEPEDPKESNNAAEAIASADFLSLPVVDPSTTGFFLKSPRSPREVENLIAVKGLPFIVQVAGRTTDNKLALKDAGTSLLKDHDNLPSYAHFMARIPHRDLTLNNVTVKDPVATLIDLESGPSTTCVQPPEYYTDLESEYHVVADVFGFGTLLWSFQNRNMPRPHASAHLERTGPFADIMNDCLMRERAERPTMTQVVQRMKAVIAANDSHFKDEGPKFLKEEAELVKERAFVIEE